MMPQPSRELLSRPSLTEVASYKSLGFDKFENERLAAIAHYDVLDTPREEAFDRITRLAQKLFQVPISVVTIIDAHRSWFKSCHGLEGQEAPREHAFCNLTIREHLPLVVLDATKDERFAQNPFVTAPNGVRFYAGIPLHTRDGYNIGTLCIVDTKPREFDAAQVSLLVDLARMVMSEMELRLLATTDSLTGTLSRRAFNEAATRAAALAIRHRHDLSCIVWDLDRFKAINDTYGHSVGDTVLIKTVKACIAELRQTDSVGRMGGETFAVLLPNTKRTEALKVAEKLRNAVEQLQVVVGEKLVSFTASFGVGSLEGATNDAQTLLEHAGLGLHKAKANGRNRSVMWSDPDNPMIFQKRRVLKAGQIHFNGRTSVIDCTVRTMSDEGAGIDVISSAMVPKHFELAIKADDFRKSCKVLSHSEKHIEVAYC